MSASRARRTASRTAFFVTFGSEADRDDYLPHPDHTAFGALLRPHLEKVLVVD